MDAPAVEIYGGAAVMTGGEDRSGLRILVIQTAFPGDVVLTLPMVGQITACFPGSEADLLVIPAAANIPEHHPAVHAVFQYDKRGRDAGIRGFLSVLRQIRKNRYAIAIVPHRSLRSALLPFMAGIRVRVGFDRSAGWLFFNRVIPYDSDLHEIKRNLQLLNGLEIQVKEDIKPNLYPGEEEKKSVDRFLRESGIGPEAKILAIAPGSVWATKRWPDYYFAETARMLRDEGWQIVLIGGKDDAPLCEQIVRMGGSMGIFSTAGRFNFLESAGLIRRSRLLLTNDSAPLHLACAVGTPVAAIFGSTVPRFGFGPTGRMDRVIEIDGLPCRPCGIHGRDDCPIGSFPCMLRIRPSAVLDAIHAILAETEASG
jgi:heptosyltransferase-2